MLPTKTVYSKFGLDYKPTTFERIVFWSLMTLFTLSIVASATAYVFSIFKPVNWL